MRDGLRIAYLNQEFDVDFSRTVWEEFMAVYDHINKVNAGLLDMWDVGRLQRDLFIHTVLGGLDSMRMVCRQPGGIRDNGF